MRRNGKSVCKFRKIFMVALSVLAVVGSAKADFVFGPAANLGTSVNGSYGEGEPSISADDLSLYFNSNRPGGRGGFDMWVAVRASADDEWGKPENLGPIVNLASSEASANISSDGLSLYFESNRPNGTGHFPHIFVSTRAAIEDPWGPAEHLGPMNSHGTGDPSISADGLSLYFASDRPGAWGGADIYVTTRPSLADPWEEPINLGPPINSSAFEGLPHLSFDGRVLFFTSNRAGGIGSHDIWMAVRATTNDSWGDPVNLGPEVNSSASDFGPCVSSDGSMLYFCSWRSDGFGQVDIWQAPIIPVVDFSGDGTADSEDESVLMDHLGQNEPLCDIGPMPWGDGIVDIQDLWVLAEYLEVKDMVLVHTPSLHAVDVPHDLTLRWLPAEIADTHDVYLGTSFEDVAAADRDDPLNVLVSQDQSVNTFDTGRLAFDQTYYWRIDEVTATFEPAIYKGMVMDFTTEPLAYPLETVTATASTSDAGAGPENTINGSGLTADGAHSTAATDMWLAGGNGVDPVWIQYEFDKVYRLHEMLVWNYNVQFELVLGFGLKDVTVEYSENGTDWTVLGDVELTQATATTTYTANTTVDFGGVAAKHVRLTVNSGWGMMGKYGLSEVRFHHIPTHARKPEPTDGETGVSPDTILSWRAGREAAAHDVYLSTDRQAVVDGTALVDTVAANSYLPDPLDPGQTYYWRINEINEAETVSAWEGDVWEFTTAE